MSRSLLNPPVGFDDLPVEEQIDYVQALWDRITAKDEQVSVPAWHRAIIDERLAEYEADPDAGRSWEQVEADLRARLTSRR